MGIEAAIAAQVAVGVIKGVAAEQAGKETQKQFKKQAEVVLREAKRDAGRLRMTFKQENAEFKLQALHQGVGVSGSIANVLASRENLQDDEARSIVDRGNAQSSLLLAQGRRARNEGRAALIGNVLGGITDGMTTSVMASGLKTESLGSGLKLSSPSSTSTLQPSVVNPVNTFRDFGGLEGIGSDFIGTN